MLNSFQHFIKRTIVSIIKLPVAGKFCNLYYVQYVIGRQVHSLVSLASCCILITFQQFFIY
jgi:hypothetical protein